MKRVFGESSPEGPASFPGRDTHILQYLVHLLRSRTTRAHKGPQLRLMMSPEPQELLVGIHRLVRRMAVVGRYGWVLHTIAAASREN